MRDKYQINSMQQLREIIPAPKGAPNEKVDHELDTNAAQFISEAPLVFVTTVDANFNLDVSPKGDAPGFVKVADNRTLLLPERSGNRLTFGFQNILQTGAIGLIFVVPGVRETLRVNGRAELSREPELLSLLAAGDRPALLVTRVSVRESFFHCGKALIRSKAWDASTWAPAHSKAAAANNWSRVFKMTRGEVDDALENDYRSNL
jgi:PPOX class probable FMN-dependent enzyme